MQINKNEIVEFINSLSGYVGYIQFSHRAIDKDKDIFLKDRAVKIEKEEGFIYEAHFCNDQESISIKQVNASWFVSKENLSQIEPEDTQDFISDIKDFNYRIKMAQVWKEEADYFCEGMMVKKLKKVVFLGFTGGEK